MLNSCAVIQQAINAGAILVDVRTAVEWNQGHLKEAINVPLETLPYFVDREFNTETTYLLYCRTGSRSQMAKEYLESHGIKAYNVGMAKVIKACQ